MRNKSNLVAAMVVMKKKYLLCCCMLVVMINITRGSLIPYHIYGDAFASTEFVLPPDIYPVPHWDSDSYDLTSNAPISCGITIYEMWTDYGYGPFEATSSAGNFSVTTSVNAEQAYTTYCQIDAYAEAILEFQPLPGATNLDIDFFRSHPFPGPDSTEDSLVIMDLTSNTELFSSSSSQSNMATEYFQDFTVPLVVDSTHTYSLYMMSHAYFSNLYSAFPQSSELRVVGNFNEQVNIIPEPSTLLLLGLGAVMLRRKR